MTLGFTRDPEEMQRLHSKSTETISTVTGTRSVALLSEVASSQGGNSPRVEVDAVNAARPAPLLLPVGRVLPPPGEEEEPQSCGIHPESPLRSRRRRRRRSDYPDNEPEQPLAAIDASRNRKAAALETQRQIAASASPQRAWTTVAHGYDDEAAMLPQAYSCSPVRARNGRRGIMSTDMAMRAPVADDFMPVLPGDASTRAPPRNCAAMGYNASHSQPVSLCAAMPATIVAAPPITAGGGARRVSSVMSTSPGSGHSVFQPPTAFAPLGFAPAQQQQLQRHGDVFAWLGGTAMDAGLGEDLAAQLHAAAPERYED